MTATRSTCLRGRRMRRREHGCGYSSAVRRGRGAVSVALRVV